MRQISFWVIWAGFLIYAFGFAPPNSPDTLDLILDLSTGNWDGINPLIIALFNLMGILPMIYACFLFIDGRGQKLWAWLFAVVSFGVGAFALVPYLALRAPNPSFSGQKDLLLKILDSRWLGVLLTVATTVLVGFGVLQGDWSNFVSQWQTTRFIHVMSLDFCLLCVLVPALLGHDLARRGIHNPAIFWAVSLVPLFGTLIYLCLRPPLPNTEEAVLKPSPTV